MAKKQGRLREEEIFFVEHNPHMSVEDLAKKLNRSEASIEKIVQANVESAQEVEEVEEVEETVEETVEEVAEETAKPIDGTRSRTENLGKVGGWVVMTPGVSGRADAPSVGDGTGTGAPQKFYSRTGATGVRPAKRAE